MKWQHLVPAALTASMVNAALPVCIVGAGPAGLAAANKLEANGHHVVVFEKQARVGGKCQAVYPGSVRPTRQDSSDGLTGTDPSTPSGLSSFPTPPTGRRSRSSTPLVLRPFRSEPAPSGGTTT